MKPTLEDIRIGRRAALEDLIATCESDIGHFVRDDLSEAQNTEMQTELVSLSLELKERHDALLRENHTGLLEDMQRMDREGVDG